MPGVHAYYADPMHNRHPLRLPRKLLAILAAIAASPPGAPAWGLSIRERTGYRLDVIVIKLGLLVDAGWIIGYNEQKPGGRRLYRITPAGRERLEEALRAEADRNTRPRRWRIPLVMGRSPGTVLASPPREGTS